MADSVYGMELKGELPKNCTPIQAIVIVEAMDEDGDTFLWETTTDNMRAWVMVGMLTGVLDAQRADIVEAMNDDGDDDA
jgi:hypothetical protein